MFSTIPIIGTLTWWKNELVSCSSSCVITLSNMSIPLTTSTWASRCGVVTINADEKLSVYQTENVYESKLDCSSRPAWAWSGHLLSLAENPQADSRVRPLPKSVCKLDLSETLFTVPVGCRGKSLYDTTSLKFCPCLPWWRIRSVRVLP